MSVSNLQLSAKSVSILLGNIFGPSVYDDPRFGDGDPGPGGFRSLISNLRSDRLSLVALNPQPLPPGEMYALNIADAHIHRLLALDQVGTLFGGEAKERSLELSLRYVSDADEFCPLWPKWPKTWPPPPRPPWLRNQEMTFTELFVFGSRLLAASDLIEQSQLGDAVAALGEKALHFSMREQSA